MAVVAQLVRALVCGAGGRGFEPHRPPQKSLSHFVEDFFVYWVFALGIAVEINFA